MTDIVKPDAGETASSDQAVIGRRRLLRLGAVAAPAVVTLSATPAFAAAVQSVTCQATLPQGVCFPRASNATDADVVAAIPVPGNGTAPAAYCDGLNNTTPHIDAKFAPSPASPTPATTLGDWAMNVNTSSDERAWISWLQTANGNGFGGSCLSSVYVSGGVPRL